MRHPPQREMWEGLTLSGCLTIIVAIFAVSFLVEVIF